MKCVAAWLYTYTVSFCESIENFGCSDDTQWNSCGMWEHTASIKCRGGNAPHLIQLHFRAVHAGPCEKESLLDHQCQMAGQAHFFSPQMHHFEVTLIYQKLNFPLYPPRKWISQAKTPERAQAFTWCKSGGKQSETILLHLQTLSRPILLSK